MDRSVDSIGACSLDVDASVELPGRKCGFVVVVFFFNIQNVETPPFYLHSSGDF